MAKRKDKASVVVRKRAFGPNGYLTPVSAFDAEVLDGFAIDTEFDIEPRTRRSLPQQRLYWAALDKVVKSTDRWPTKEKLHDALVRACGFVEVNYGLDGMPYITRDSTSFDAMDAEEFRTYFDRAMMKLAEAVGFDPLSVEAAA